MEQKEIRQLYCEILGTDDLSTKQVPELLELLQPDSLLERFAAKKAQRITHTKDFVNMNGGIKGQLEEAHADVQNPNENVGFKCLSYSVTESNGHVEVTILKKDNTSDFTFGVRTLDGSATVGKDYELYEQTHTLDRQSTEMKV